MSVTVYTFGLCHCSVCVPAGMKREDIERGADLAHPTGLDHGWSISSDPTFRAGQPNPCICNADTSRQHYLMVC